MPKLKKSRFKYDDKTKEQLIDELRELRQQIANFKTYEIKNKQALIKLRESEEKYKSIIELAPDSIITFNQKGIITSFNKNFSNLSGYTREEILNKQFTKLPSIPKKELPKCLKIFNFLSKGMLPKPFEIKLIHKDGTPQIAEVRVSLLKRGNKMIGFQAIARDITGRKQMEQALMESAESYRELADSITDVFFEMDKNLQYTYWNKASENLTGISAIDALGKSLYDLFPDVKETKVEKMYLEVLRAQQPKFFENQYQIKNKNFIFEISAYPSKRGLTVFVKDITKRKQTENLLKEALREKDIMLNEIHHRVKNNLQIISSLLRIQLKSIRDKKLREVLNLCQNRIKSMALIHDILHKSKDLSRINFTDYIRNMTTHLFSIYYEKAKHIRFELDAGETYIDITKAVPCGLIINELVSNSLKHAFPKKRRGKISIKIDEDMGKQFTLIVSDNGIGIPKNIDFSNTQSLGMQLVNDLVRQIEGHVDLKRERGTSFQITF